MGKNNFETICVHGSYKAENAAPQNLPIIQSTTYRYYNTKDVAELFDLESPAGSKGVALYFVIQRRRRPRN